MKTIVNKDKSFSPVRLEITFETQAELDFFTSLCNLAPMVDTAHDFGASLPRCDDLIKVGGDSNKISKILEAFLNTSCVQSRLKK